MSISYDSAVRDYNIETSFQIVFLFSINEHLSCPGQMFFTPAVVQTHGKGAEQSYSGLDICSTMVGATVVDVVVLEDVLDGMIACMP